MSNPTDIGQFIADLNGGVFDEQVSMMLSTVAAAVVDHKKAGQVQLTFTLKQVGEGHQVQIAHELKFKQPTARGAVIQNDLTDTIMYVGIGGKTTLLPETQALKGQMHIADKDNSNKLITGGEK